MLEIEIKYKKKFVFGYMGGRGRGNKRKQKVTDSPVSPNSQQQKPENPAIRDKVKDSQSDNPASPGVTMAPKVDKSSSEFEKRLMDKMDTLATKVDLESMVKKEDIKTLEDDVKVLKTEFGKLSMSLGTTKTELVGKINEAKTELNEGIAKIKDELASEMATVNHRFESFGDRLTRLEVNQPQRKEFDKMFSVVITGLSYVPDEDPIQRAQVVVEAMGITDISVICAKRYGCKPLQGKPGVITAEFSTEQEKDRVLESAKNLNNNPIYKKVYVNPKRDDLHMAQVRSMNKLLDLIPGARETKYVNRNAEIVDKRDRGSTGVGRGMRGGYGRGSYNNIGHRPPPNPVDSLIGATAVGSGDRQEFDMRDMRDFPVLNRQEPVGPRFGPTVRNATPPNIRPRAPGMAGMPPMNVPPPPLPQGVRQSAPTRAAPPRQPEPNTNDTATE